MKALLLSAGFGTRLGELTRHTPKCLLEVAGKPIIDHQIDWLLSQGIAEKSIGVNTHYLHEQVEEHLSISHPDVFISYEVELQGTGGALIGFADFVEGETFVVMLCDTLTTLSVRQMLRCHNSLCTISMSQMNPQKALSKGIVVPAENGNSGRVLAFIEKPEFLRLNTTCYVWSGIAIIEPTALHSITEQQDISIIFRSLCAQKQLGYCSHDHDWLDIGTHDDFSLANGWIAQRNRGLPQSIL